MSDNEFNNVEISSVSDFIAHLNDITKNSDLYKEIINSFLKEEAESIKYNEIYKKAFILDEFEHLVNWLSSYKNANEYSEFDSIVDITEQLGNIIKSKLAEFMQFNKTKMDTLLKEFQSHKNNRQVSLNNSVTPFNFYYRGESSVDWSFNPSILRTKETYHRESYFYHEIQVRCPGNFLNMSNLDKLVTMQHYGCQTRLLDITPNPLGALYFACEQEDNKDGRISIFPIVKGTISYGDSDKSLILSCISHLTYAEQQGILDEITNSNKWIYDGSENTPHIDKLYLEICAEKPSFQKRILFKDLLTPLFVQPNRINPRITNQQGAFLLSGLSDDINSSENKIKRRIAKTRFLIKPANKKRILQQLDTLGINEASVYPDIEKVANYIKNH